MEVLHPLYNYLSSEGKGLAPLRQDITNQEVVYVDGTGQIMVGTVIHIPSLDTLVVTPVDQTGPVTISIPNNYVCLGTDFGKNIDVRMPESESDSMMTSGGYKKRRKSQKRRKSNRRR